MEATYKRLEPVQGCTGFVAHVNDAANYDIDICLPPQFRRRYSQAIINQFTFSYLPESDFITGHDPTLIREQTGYAYRCRLRGIGVTKTPDKALHRELTHRVQHLINQADRYVTVAISDIDVYRRVLVDILVPLESQNVDLKTFILQHDPDHACYYSYSR